MDDFLPTALTSKEPAILLKDRWLADSSAEKMIKNQFSDFIDYKIEPLDIESAGGTTVSPGFGSVKLKASLTNGTFREVRLNYVRYMPQFPLKLFSIKQTMKTGGSLHNNRNMFVDEGNITELCETDSPGFLIESKHCQTDAYFNALVSATQIVSLDTWHRRLAHISTTNVIRTKNIVRGMGIKPFTESKSFICDVCE
ncbi:Gag-Pol polyprotein [Golovinomyces cichoracearum]|uniref:Gag-Pol polyprotein n=1 Tax=Golovinomyces cichoracearum TaxID=62708 RepID=A0A420HRT0_9PEZI|nr:Gag-Pol polyprotein [Golovinomyces cichoracearum]